MKKRCMEGEGMREGLELPCSFWVFIIQEAPLSWLCASSLDPVLLEGPHYIETTHYIIGH